MSNKTARNYEKNGKIMLEAMSVEQKLILELNCVVNHINNKFTLVSDELDNIKLEIEKLKEQINKLYENG